MNVGCAAPLTPDRLTEEKNLNMLQELNISLIGSGNMAEAMIKGLLDKGMARPSNLFASDPVDERRQIMQEHYHLEVTSDNRLAAQRGDVVILAVKPQVLPHVMSDIRGMVRSSALVISIVAGVPIQTISQGIEHEAIVRVIPNTPAMVGQGMSVWTATSAVSQQQREQARLILRSLGEEMEVEREDYIDMATAVSGSGPAYVFLFIEALTDAAVHLGFSRPMAERIVLQTLQGAVALAKESSAHPAELRNKVTSPAGTTAEALYQLEKGGFRAVISKAVWAAYQKSRSLGGLSNR
mgnify:CR=1 FL=1